MENQPVTSKQYFRALSIIYYALMIGPLIFVGVVLFLKSEIALNINPKLEFIITFITPVVVVVGFFFSRSFFKNQLEKIKRENDLILKMQKYRSALIIKYSILEFCLLIPAIATLLTENTIFLVFSIIVALLFFVDKPSAIRAARELELHPDDVQRLYNPDEIIA